MPDTDEILITGQTGQENVTAEAVRELISGLVGTGQYVVKGFECSLSGTSAVNVTGGVVCMNGAEVYLNSAGRSISIDQGASGTNRQDLIVIRFTRSEQGGTNIESCDIVYIKGTAASSPVDPTYNSGSILDGTAVVDMPLARITWTGVVPVIENIAEKFQSASEFRASIDQTGISFIVRDIYLSSVAGNRAVTAPDIDGYTFLCWAGAAADGTVVSAYIEWPSARASRVWIVGGGTANVLCVALYVSNNASRFT